MRTHSILALAIIALLVGTAAEAKYSGGTGEPDDPYLIATAENMNEIGANPNDWDAHFLMTADVNLADYTGTQFNIIGNADTRFTGVFDGNCHTISNFIYTCTGTNNIGIFGYVDATNAKIKNLTLINPNVDAGTGYRIGSLVGWLGSGTISGCAAEGGSVSGGDYNIGGLVGSNDYGGISNCYATGAVSGNDWHTGGLVGHNGYGEISNCYAAGAVSGVDFTGGLVGKNNYGEISNCYATGAVTGDNSSIGGLVGLNYGTISNCYATGAVPGVGNYIGGLVGHNDGEHGYGFFLGY